RRRAADGARRPHRLRAAHPVRPPPAVRGARLSPRRGLAVRLLARLGWAARGRTHGGGRARPGRRARRDRAPRRPVPRALRGHRRGARADPDRQPGAGVDGRCGLRAARRLGRADGGAHRRGGDELRRTGMAARAWWRDGVLYQLYPRSYADSDGDGIGDLRGIIDHLDHIAWLGIDGLWLNPTFPSPNADWGFDVADYRDVHPDLGTLADLEALITAAGERGIRVLLDLVPNHTSDEHPWFVEARGDRDAPHRDWYVWRDPGPDGRPPNNWQSLFGGPAWEPDGATGQSYLHLFHRKQPDLNWWSEDVRRAFDEILGFWYDRGVAGFRVDVANGIVKDRALRDNPPFATREEEHAWRPLGQVPRHSLNQPEVHDVFRRWRALGAGRDPEPLLLGETVVRDLEQLMRFYGDDDGLQLALNVPFLDADLDATELSAVVARTEGLLPDRAWPLWTASNHDVVRFPTRWANGDERRIRVALMLLLTL